MNSTPPLTFERLSASGSTVYPFTVKAKRGMSRPEAKAAREFCEVNFGPGGRIREMDFRWFCDEDQGVFSFTTETDMTMFVVVFSG